MSNQKRIIKVMDYDPSWPEKFSNEAQAIQQVLTDQIVRTHHIGSTAVAGLKAKPVIDILLEMRNVKNLDAFDQQMEIIGYTPKGEFGIPGRRFYFKGLYYRTYHIHAFNVGSPDVYRHLAFRDYLITHPQVAKEYENLKIRCADACNNDENKYCDGKREFLQMYEKMAIEWRKCQQGGAVVP